MIKTDDVNKAESTQLDFSNMDETFSETDANDEYQAAGCTAEAGGRKHLPPRQQGSFTTPQSPGTFVVGRPWPERFRAAPTAFLRSALFSTNRRPVDPMRYEQIASTKPVTLIVSGDSLTQFDLDLWMACVHLARHGKPVQATIRELLVVAGRAQGGTAAARVRERLEVLCAFHFCIEVGSADQTLNQGEASTSYIYAGRLLEQMSWRPGPINRSVGTVVLHPNLAELFQPSRRTLIHANSRSKIGDRPLAQWFNAFLRTHTMPYPWSIWTYHRLTGTKSPMLDFTRRTKAAMEFLAERSLIYSAKLKHDNDVLFVQKNIPGIEKEAPDPEVTWAAYCPRAKRILASQKGANSNGQS